jgi:hypothetical protein
LNTVDMQTHLPSPDFNNMTDFPIVLSPDSQEEEEEEEISTSSDPSFCIDHHPETNEIESLCQEHDAWAQSAIPFHYTPKGQHLMDQQHGQFPTTAKKGRRASKKSSRSYGSSGGSSTGAASSSGVTPPSFADLSSLPLRTGVTGEGKIYSIESESSRNSNSDDFGTSEDEARRRSSVLEYDTLSSDED